MRSSDFRDERRIIFPFRRALKCPADTENLLKQANHYFSAFVRRIPFVHALSVLAENFNHRANGKVIQSQILTPLKKGHPPALGGEHRLKKRHFERSDL